MTTMLHESVPTSAWDGIYHHTEAARYIRVAGYRYLPRSRRTIADWFRRWTDDGELSKSSGGGEFPVNFLDLVSMRLVAAFRVSGEREDTIRTIVGELSRYAGTQYPLASRDIWADYGWVDEIEDLMYPVLASPGAAGPDFVDLLDFILPEHGLTFDEESGRATSWEVSKGIVLHPLVQSGAPCIKGTRIPTRSLAGMVAAGDSVEGVAESYQLTPATVKVACDWESRLKSI